jgi:broad specificity phosphatase PhoE
VSHVFWLFYAPRRLTNRSRVADPQLTQLGVQQAQDARLEWEKERLFDIPLPQKLYTSPLTRAIRTNQITFDETLVPGLKTTVVEVARVPVLRRSKHSNLIPENSRAQRRAHLRQEAYAIRNPERVSKNPIRTRFHRRGFALGA